MTPKLVAGLMLLAVLVATPMAYGDADDDATITVVEEGDTPDDVVKVIELPERASSAANPVSEKANNGKGNDKAGETGREFGQQVSEDARNKDLKDQVRVEAKQQGKSDARNENAGGNRHGPPH